MRKGNYKVIINNCVPALNQTLLFLATSIKSRGQVDPGKGRLERWYVGTDGAGFVNNSLERIFSSLEDNGPGQT